MHNSFNLVISLFHLEVFHVEHWRDHVRKDQSLRHAAILKELFGSSGCSNSFYVSLPLLLYKLEEIF